MKRLLIIWCFTCLALHISGQVYSTLDLQENQSYGLLEIIHKIEDSNTYQCIYSSDKIRQVDHKKIKIPEDMTIEQLLTLLKYEYAIEMRVKPFKRIVFTPSNLQKANQTPITRQLTVMDRATGEAIIGAAVFSPNLSFGTITDNSGHAFIEYDAMSDSIVVSHLNYKEVTFHSDELKKDDLLVLLDEEREELLEVTITDQNPIKFELQQNDNGYLTAAQLNTNFVMMDNDPVKQIMQFSGIQSGREGQNQLYVRGGSSDQNLILLDGSPLYETSHILGLSSIFNKNSIKNISVYKHGFPAQYSGKLSSVVDIVSKEGNSRKTSGKIELSPLNINATLEGPIVKNTLSYHLSAKKSLVNTSYKKLLNSRLQFDESDFKFHDLMGKLHYKISAKQTLSLHYFQSRDNMQFEYSEIFNNSDSDFNFFKDDEVQWTSETGGLNWTYFIGSKWKIKLHGSISDYTNRFKSLNGFYLENNLDTLTNGLNVATSSKLTDYTYKMDNQTFLSDNVHINWGASYLHQEQQPYIRQSDLFLDTSIINITDDFPLTSYNETSVYTELESDGINKWDYNIGLRFSSYHSDSLDYSIFQPRFFLKYNINPQHHLFISATQMVQFNHLLINPGIGLPSDLWIPSSEELLPEKSQQLTIGYSNQTNPIFDYNISLYYKRLEHLVDYQSPFDLYYNFLNNENSETIFNGSLNYSSFVSSGEGRSYGVETTLRVKLKKVKMHLSYALGKAERKFDSINNGEYFPYKYDRRHDLSANLQYTLNKKASLYSNFVFGSGDAFTLANELSFLPDGTPILSSQGRNTFRLPNYIRLDLGARYIFGKSLHLDLGIYNVLNRANVYYSYLFENKADTSNDYNYVLRSISLFPIMPQFNLSYRF